MLGWFCHFIARGVGANDRPASAVYTLRYRHTVTNPLGTNFDHILLTSFLSQVLELRGGDRIFRCDLHLTLTSKPNPNVSLRKLLAARAWSWHLEAPAKAALLYNVLLTAFLLLLFVVCFPTLTHMSRCFDILPPLSARRSVAVAVPALLHGGYARNQRLVDLETLLRSFYAPTTLGLNHLARKRQRDRVLCKDIPMHKCRRTHTLLRRRGGEAETE